jgi:hypothetical protein
LLDQRILHARRVLNPDSAAPMPPWRLHDLRRTVATGLQRLGVRLEVIEAVLGHVSGSRAGIVGVYQCHRFDGEAHEALVSAPGDLDAKVRFVTIYHLVLESTLGLTSFRFITRYLEREGLLPGFVEGYSKIHHDETRHISYGVWFLRESVREHEQAAHTIRATLAELSPVMAEALTPPDRESDTDWDALGAGADEIREFALGGLTRRLEIIGAPL